MNKLTSPLTDSSVLVTGGTGFIGSHLVEKLVHLDARVTVVDNIATGRITNLNAVRDQSNLVVGDIGDLLRLKRVKLEEYNYVFHLAANPYIPTSVDHPALDYRLNIDNTFNLLEALRVTPNAPRLINISSAAVYGNPAQLPIRETDPTVPISPYGASKLAAERYTAVYSQIYGVRATSLRFFSIYGPRQRKQVVYDLLCKLYANPAQIEVLGDGSQARDFTYVQDVVAAVIVAATSAPGQGESYNVASGKTYSIAQLVETWCEVCNFSPKIVYTGKVRPGDAEKWEVDINNLTSLGYKAQTSLAEGLKSVWDWYRQEVMVDEHRTH